VASAPIKPCQTSLGSQATVNGVRLAAKVQRSLGVKHIEEGRGHIASNPKRIRMGQ